MKSAGLYALGLIPALVGIAGFVFLRLRRFQAIAGRKATRRYIGGYVYTNLARRLAVIAFAGLGLALLHWAVGLVVAYAALAGTLIDWYHRRMARIFWTYRKFELDRYLGFPDFSDGSCIYRYQEDDPDLEYPVEEEKP